MGSASGAAKAAKSFFYRGYAVGYRNYPQVTEKTLGYHSDTISRSFRGLFRLGYLYGTHDRIEGASPSPHLRYEDRHRFSGEKLPPD
jgi:hypothetical protein